MAATPATFQHYTKHLAGASFGTKFEGLAVSRAVPEQVGGLFHAGSVGIIMSGWLGAMNYGVIVANDVDSLLFENAGQIADARFRADQGGRQVAGKGAGQRQLQRFHVERIDDRSL